ncbi:AMP-binding protein [Mycolicibacterium chitae]|uniref:Fatty-acid--CoA ligase fadD28 n=1 Tax=Mycolicibacterium chitae TaxID=1792 RepID=A0A448HYC2_MYCCI|nr:AMP-binding protein [Mycolicibacterium chitae]VEG45226.1 fatty-acid--CoA ligase fadD28 [Mycolicibacterium chitae]
MLVGETTILTLLCERAGLQGDDPAVTFVDYDHDWAGVAETLTYAQLYRRVLNLARHLQDLGSAGDRAVILAPQGLDYIVGFFGALQAGRIAVPLSAPLGGVSDERVSSVLSDALPSVILTTTAVADTVAEYVPPGSGASIVVLDSVDLDGPAGRVVTAGTPTDTAYLQYTSGSTRRPAGVMMSHRNLMANFEQLMAGYFAHYGNVIPPGGTIVSWLPFYHDMGLYLGVCGPVLAGVPAVLMSPLAFLQRPARWMQLLACHGRTYTAAPNFAFELAVRKTSDDDMAGLDLADVLVIITGAERVHPATLRRFTQRFASFNLREEVLRPSYGLAEATVYVATAPAEQPPDIVRFDSEPLTTGRAQRSENGSGTPLVSYGIPSAPVIRIVDPETRAECPAGTVGEIWVHGDNVAAGYWQKPTETATTFGATLAAYNNGTPEGPWLRTGDLGFISDDGLFIVGRIKDLLIVYGRNHSPDDIEATIQEITFGRCAAIAVPDGTAEKLVVIAEVKKRGDSHQEAMDKLLMVKRDVNSAVFSSHSVGVADLVLVPPGSIPVTTSGKVRRAECVEQYRRAQFARLDA